MWVDGTATTLSRYCARLRKQTITIPGLWICRRKPLRFNELQIPFRFRMPDDSWRPMIFVAYSKAVRNASRRSVSTTRRSAPSDAFRSIGLCSCILSAALRRGSASDSCSANNLAPPTASVLKPPRFSTGTQATARATLLDRRLPTSGRNDWSRRRDLMLMLVPHNIMIL